MSVTFENNLRSSDRRRALFPGSSSDIDSDLGHMSPISSSTSSSDNEELFLSKNGHNTIGDYDIIGIVDNNLITDIVQTPQQNKNIDLFTESTMSPLYLSPYVKKRTTDLDTPLKSSPSERLKTPHDTSNNTNSKLPKLSRKSLLDACFSEESKQKRKIDDSPETQNSENKIIKLDNTAHHSKVRTALFPDLTIPSKAFYPKSESVTTYRSFHNHHYTMKPVERVKTGVRRRGVTRKKTSSINAGVSHKIRKPKQKKLSKKVLEKALNISNDPALQEYLQDLKNLKEPAQKMIENKENDPLMQGYLQELKNVTKPTQSLIKPAIFDSTKKRPHSPDREQPKKFKSFDFDTSDLITQDDDVTPNIDNILTSLDEEDNNKIVLQAHDSVLESENSIQLHQAPQRSSSNIANILLSPTSLMCDMASGLAINSPKKVKNLTTILENIPNNNTMSSGPRKKFEKLFPMFNLSNKNKNDSPNKNNKLEACKSTRSLRKMKNLPAEQMLLDAGQKKFGVVQCPECHFVYHIGDPSDESMHLNYHSAGNVFKYNGWKNERVVSSLDNCKIVKILPGDPKIWWKKVTDLLQVVNRDLGEENEQFFMEECQVYLYIKNKLIVGIATAISKTTGYKMLSLGSDMDMCSEESYPIKCGISKIWVHDNHRKQGVASSLMAAIQKNFIFGYILPHHEVAMGTPHAFAQKYFKTPEYLIYM